jgi:hypothetical protein
VPIISLYPGSEPNAVLNVAMITLRIRKADATASA